MPYPLFSLQDLSEFIVQGLPVTRYRDEEEGKLKSIVNVQDLNDLYIKHELERVRLGETVNIKNFSLQENDVIIAVRGSLLKSSVITKTSEGSLAGSNVAILRPKTLNQVNPAYIAVLLRSKIMELLSVLPRRSSINLPSIRISEVRELNIPLPSMAIQDQIVQLYRLTEQYAKLTNDELSFRKELTESVIYQLWR